MSDEPVVCGIHGGGGAGGGFAHNVLFHFVGNQLNRARALIIHKGTKMRKKLASAFDGIRNLHLRGDADRNESADDLDADALPTLEPTVEERLTPQHCQLSNIVRHGFPSEPYCMAYDCVQRLLAVGAARGALRFLGQSGVDVHLTHESTAPVIFVQFLVNEGGLVTALRDDTIHLWNYRQTQPKIVHSLKMSKERVSCVYLPFQSRWLYVGTDKGNVYFVSLANFELSNYVINWNKATDVNCRVHPGAVVQMRLCPNDPNKLLLVFERGQVVLWSFQSRESVRFAVDYPPVRCASWHNDGRQFMCGHKNGTLTIWNIKRPRELVHKMTPHSISAHNAATNPPSDASSLSSGGGGVDGPTVAAQNNVNAAVVASTVATTTEFRPITHLDWSATADGEQMVIFAGGMPLDDGVLPALTILHAKGSVTVLEMDYPIVELCPLNNSPFASVAQLPYGVAALLKQDLLVIDLGASGYPCFENPYPLDIHESPVTFLAYYADCPVDLIAALTLVGRNQRRNDVRLSDKSWPITGGISRECATGFQEMLLTGHEDGSIKFWQASSETLQLMYRLKTGRHFERVATPQESRSATTASTGIGQKMPAAAVSHAIADVQLCVESRLMLVASASGQVTLFRFSKTETCQDIAVIVVPQLCSAPVPAVAASTAGGTPPPSASPNSAVVEEEPSEAASPSSAFASVSVLRHHHRHLRPHQSSSASSTASSGTGAHHELKRHGAMDSAAGVSASSHDTDSHSTDTSVGSQLGDQLPLKVRGGALRRPAGYQPELVCQIPWVGGQTPERIIAMALNSAYGVAAISTACGVALVDIVTSSLIYAWSNAELNVRDHGLVVADAQSGDASPSCSAMADGVSFPPNSNAADGAGSNGGGNHAASSSHNSSSGKFMRLNTEGKQHSIDVRHARPFLTKAQSMAVPGTSYSVNNIGENLTGDRSPQTHLTADGGGPTPAPFHHHYHNRSTDTESAMKAEHFRNGEIFGGMSPCGGAVSAVADNLGSRCSSTGSLDPDANASAHLHSSSASVEHVTSLTFINACSKKGYPRSEPTLWLGMSTGVCVAFHLMLPADRIIASVVVAPSGALVRLHDRVLTALFLNRELCLMAGAAETFKDPMKESSAPSSANLDRFLQNKVLTKSSQSPSMLNPPSDSPSLEEFLQLGIFVSSREVRAISLPGFTQFFRHRAEVPFIKAKSSHINGAPVLMCLNISNAVVVLSLPSLKVLLQSSLSQFPATLDEDACQRTDFSEHGLGMYAASPTEIQRFTVNSELSGQISECAGELFVPCDTPEPPKTSFFRGVSTLFAGNNQKDNVDIDAIFSEKPQTSTTSTKSIARQISCNVPNSSQQQLSSMESANSAGISAGTAAAMAIQNLNERSERLNAVADATENLRNNAMSLQSRSSKLVERYEKKKWYQL